MVLYTGDNTSIFQKSFIEKLGTGSRRVKQPKMFDFLNGVIVFLCCASMLISIGFTIILLTTKSSFDIVKVIESNTIGFNWFKKLVAIFTFTLNIVPWTLRIIGEVSCIVVAIRVKMIKIEYILPFGFSQSDRDVDKHIMESKHSGGRPHIGRRKSSTAFGLSMKSSSNDSNGDGFFSSRGLERRNTIGKGSSKLSDSHEPNSPAILEGNSLKPSNRSPGKSDAKRNSEKEIQDMMSVHLNVVNYLVLPDMGGIDQVCFDKTDTLTSGIMAVAELTTCMKCYRVPSQGISSMIVECKANPDSFGYEDDQVNMLESEEYSEKSQEYLDEIEGHFTKHVHLEDESCDMIIDPKLYPDYAKLTHKKGQGQSEFDELQIKTNLSNDGRKSDRNIQNDDKNTNQLNAPNTNFGSKESPRGETGFANEIRYLNMLEKKFRQKMNPRSANAQSNTSKTLPLLRPIHITSEDNAPESSSDFSADGEIGGDNRINFKIDKKLTDKNFIFDSMGKKDHLLDIFVLLMMSNEGSSVTVVHRRAM
jgi:hypothetical protein